ncbi:hypothetical protein ZWY2020_041872 [Hordeum vulgare]|nr:hypothetical protein ZWY2020_041872 [Hordeum vulgare]
MPPSPPGPAPPLAQGSLLTSARRPEILETAFKKETVGLVTREQYVEKIADKILNKKELEFNKWEGTLSDLLQNVREKLNQVAYVAPCLGGDKHGLEIRNQGDKDGERERSIARSKMLG